MAFFMRFTNDDFEIAIEIERPSGVKEMHFVTVARIDITLLCSFHSINSITYFIGEKTKMIVKLSMKQPGE